MADVIKTTFQLRRGEASVWKKNNPTLAKGEPGVELDTLKMKIGDGATPWNDLPYSGGGAAAITEEEVVQLFMEMDVLHPVTDEERFVLTDIDGKLFILQEEINMEFKRLADVEALTEIPEGANAFVEVDGEIKRVPGEGLGGAGGFKTAVIKSDIYDEALAHMNNGGRMSADPEPTYSCINMTFEEAYSTLESGEVLKAILMDATEGPMIIEMMVGFGGVRAYEGTPTIMFLAISPMTQITLFWTPNGISTQAPGDDGGK